MSTLNSVCINQPGIVLQSVAHLNKWKYIHWAKKKSRRNDESDRCYHLELRPEIHEFFEGFPKLGVEYGIDDRIHETVHVTQPRG